jgi:hypothetical protein
MAISAVTLAELSGGQARRTRQLPPVGDIDVLILGDPDRDQLCTALSNAESRLGRPVQVTIREPGWLESGTGTFHDTLTSRSRFAAIVTWLPPT